MAAKHWAVPTPQPESRGPWGGAERPAANEQVQTEPTPSQHFPTTDFDALKEDTIVGSSSGGRRMPRSSGGKIVAYKLQNPPGYSNHLRLFIIPDTIYILCK